MKTIYLLASLVVYTCLPSQGEISEPTPLLNATADVYSYAIPITEKADHAFRLILERDDCSLTDYLQRCGIRFSNGTNSSLDSEANVIRIRLDHANSTKVVMIVGSVIAVLMNENMSAEQFARDNSGAPEGYETDVDPEIDKKENKATPRKAPE